MEELRNSDENTVSNEWHELQHVANLFDIPVWKVLKAKEDLKTSDRTKLYLYLDEERNK